MLNVMSAINKTLLRKPKIKHYEPH